MITEERFEKMEIELTNVKRDIQKLMAVVMQGEAKTAGINGQLNIIKAQKFIVVDDNGKSRASLEIIKGVPSLNLSDKNGKLGISLTIIENEPSLDIYDDNEKHRVSLGVIEGMPTLALIDKNEKPRAVLSIIEDDSGDLAMFNPDGKAVWRAPR